eukprot:2691273-Rhodomonas_salina.1
MSVIVAVAVAMAVSVCPVCRCALSCAPERAATATATNTIHSLPALPLAPSHCLSAWLGAQLVQRLVMFSRAQPRKADGEATEEGANGEPKSLADRITEFGQSVQQSVARIDVVQWFKDAAAKTFEKEGEKLEPLLQ